MGTALSFYPLRFRFRAQRAMSFPQGGAGNVFRGAFGKQLRATDGDLYARLFQPISPAGSPSGLADAPRPIVFRARHLNGAALHAGDEFCLDFYLFDPHPESLAACIQVFEQMGSEDFAHLNGRAEPQRIELSPQGAPVRRVEVAFLSPTELKAEGQPVARPEFPILFARLRDRIDNLCRLFGEGPLEFDFEAMNASARNIRMTVCELEHVSAARYSARSGATHPLSGFVGRAVYEGDLDTFLPFLRAGECTGVGRQTVWGNGAIQVTQLEPDRPPAAA